MTIMFYDECLQQIGVCDEFKSVLEVTRLFDFSTCEICISASNPIVKKLKVNDYFVVPDELGSFKFYNFYRIEKLEYSGQETNEIIYFGYDLTKVLSQRVGYNGIINFAPNTDFKELWKHLINACFNNPLYADYRKMYGYLNPETGERELLFDENITVAIRGKTSMSTTVYESAYNKSISEFLFEFCERYGFVPKIYYNDLLHKFILELCEFNYYAQQREQFMQMPVFSDKRDTFVSTNYYEDVSNRKNILPSRTDLKYNERYEAYVKVNEDRNCNYENIQELFPTAQVFRSGDTRQVWGCEILQTRVYDSDIVHTAKYYIPQSIDFYSNGMHYLQVPMVDVVEVTRRDQSEKWANGRCQLTLLAKEILDHVKLYEDTFHINEPTKYLEGKINLINLYKREDKVDLAGYYTPQVGDKILIEHSVYGREIATITEMVKSYDDTGVHVDVSFTTKEIYKMIYGFDEKDNKVQLVEYAEGTNIHFGGEGYLKTINLDVHGVFEDVRTEKLNINGSEGAIGARDIGDRGMRIYGCSAPTDLHYIDFGVNSDASRWALIPSPGINLGEMTRRFSECYVEGISIASIDGVACSLTTNYRGLRIDPNSDVKTPVYIDFMFDEEVGWYFAPREGIGIYCGLEYRPWERVWSTHGVNQASDKRIKTEIRDMTDKYIKLLDKLQPVTYKVPSDTYRKDFIRTGLIAQDIEKAMDELGMDEHEFNALFRGDRERNYSLCYDEFISVLIKGYQDLKARVILLENKLSNADMSLDTLEETDV